MARRGAGLRCVLPSGVRRSVALVALLAGILAGRAAHADDTRDLFGLGKKKPKPEDAPPNCETPHTFGCAMVSDPLEDTAPYALATWLPADYLRQLPVANTTHDAVAHYGLGASRDEAGPVFGGATGLENRWTIEGAPSDSIRTGSAETRVPLTFLEGITVTAGGFTARDRTSTGGTIDVQLRRGGTEHELEAAVWAGISGSPPRRPIPSGSYFVRRSAIENGPEVSASLVGTGPLGALLGGTAWYAAGIAPGLSRTDVSWQASRLVDLENDGMIDGLPGAPVLQPIIATSDTSLDYFVPAMLRAGLDRGPHAIELTLIGQTSRSTRFLSNATQQAAGLDRTDVVADGIATYKGRWKRTHALVQLAWHRSDRRDTPHDDDANVPQLLSAYIPTSLPDDPQLAALCNDMTFPNIPQCAVPFGYFASAGAGPLVEIVGDRPTATAEIAHQRGANVIRAGATLEDSRLVTHSSFSGGEQQRSLFEGHLDRLRYFQGECTEVAGAPCDYVDESVLRYRTRYAAAFLEDTFTPQEGMRVDGGLRWEMMWVGPRLHFSKQFAPRLGLSWDVLGGGRSRVWTSMGRSHVMLPAGLGPTVIRRDATVHDAVNPLGESRSTDVGAAYSVAEGIEPMAQDELTAGIEVGLARTFRLTAWAQGRWLRRGLETTTQGFDNPGRAGGLPARRSSELVAAEIATSPTAKLTLRAGYLAGRTIGNYLGAYDPRQGAILYDGSDFDGSFTSSTDMGELPTSVGHRVYLEADRRGTFGSVELHVATRLTLASGRPRNAFASTDVGLIPVVPRGGAGRGPMISQANIRFAATWKGFDLTLDVFNAFDQSGATLREEVYSDSFVRPIEGGEYEDLVFLKTTDGADALRRTGYGLPLAFQGPVSAVLGIHRAF